MLSTRLGSSPAERDRLRRQSAEPRDHSALLLDRVGIAAGWQVIEWRGFFLDWGRKPGGGDTSRYRTT
jgi:hypothetical protein